MTTTQSTEENLAVKRGNGAKVHRGLYVAGRLVAWCATDTNAAGRNGITVRRVAGADVDCKACVKSL